MIAKISARLKSDEYARLGAALAAIARRKPVLVFPSPAARHLLTKSKRKPAENLSPPHIGPRRPLYNF
ncbi:MAG: hypothetical protein LJE67_15260 [Salaquimonas sp.]|nr:hypothetical protein [Salaquimonas sp.]